MTSTSLIYKATKDISETEKIKIEIRLDDECCNGHQDFSITGSIYENGRWEAGGCIHDEILKHFPKFKIFVDLHLCDWEGVPMHAVANGFYHLINGFNNTKPQDDSFVKEYCKYYRVTTKQFAKLKTAQNQTQFSLMLQSLGILKQWKIEAKEAIKLLQFLTGQRFEPNSKRSNYIAPTIEQIKDNDDKVKSGYYTQRAINKRHKAHIASLIEKIEKTAKEEIASIKTESIIKKRLMLLGGERFVDNCIYYTSSKTIGINWRNSTSDKLSEKEIKKIKNKLILPSGVTYKIN